MPRQRQKSNKLLDEYRGSHYGVWRINKNKMRNMWERSGNHISMSKLPKNNKTKKQLSTPKGNGLMHICKKCHDKDLNVTKCVMDLDNHPYTISDAMCDICGKMSRIVWCPAYNNIKKKT